MKFKKEYVRSMKLAAQLMLQGFRLLGVEQDKKNNKFDVYVFRSTPELTKAIFDFIKQNGGNKNGIDIRNSNY